jgi:hypothetical protein
MLPMNKVRQFFNNLWWQGTDDGNALHVFTRVELTTQPLKWLKYLLLERVGLTSLAELDSDIKRFKVADITQAIEYCQNTYSRSTSDSGLMTVLKAVLENKAGQLPNFRIFGLKDIDTAFSDFKKLCYHSHEVKEAWLCTSDVSIENASFGGRIIVSQSAFAPVLAEIVWFASPRLLEDFSDGPSFNYPYLRATKKPTEAAFRIDYLYIPAKHSELGLKPRMLEDFRSTLRRLNELREPTEKIVSILHSAGAGTVSLEFKSDKGNFKIIDWDTEVETSSSSYFSLRTIE